MSTSLPSQLEVDILGARQGCMLCLVCPFPFATTSGHEARGKDWHLFILLFLASMFYSC
jgi:hypothetical protein